MDYTELLCGIRFDDIRAELWGEVQAWTRERITRHTVLGRMHERKRMYWEMHLRECQDAPF